MGDSSQLVFPFIQSGTSTTFQVGFPTSIHPILKVFNGQLKRFVSGVTVDLVKFSTSGQAFRRERVEIKEELG